MSQGVFDQYYFGFIKPSYKSLNDIIVINSSEPERSNINPERGSSKINRTLCFEYNFEDPLKHTLIVEAFPTKHGDLMNWESFGLIISIKKNGELLRSIGYTSDAHWTESFSEVFSECNTVCAHLGSIIDVLGGKDFCSLCKNFKKETNSNFCVKLESCKQDKFANRETNLEKLLDQVHEQKHLYLSGLTMFFENLLDAEKMELAIISEFGEELKNGLRIDLYKKFSQWFQERNKNAACLPGDIGLEIDALSNNVLCTCCQQFKPSHKITPIAFGKDEAIFFVCDECQSILSSYQIGQKLSDYYENGRKLELLDEFKK